MKKLPVFRTISFSFLLLYSTLVLAEEVNVKELFVGTGPISVRNNMPLYLFFLAMPPDKARVIARNRLSIGMAYTVSNITASAFTPGTALYNVQIDAETSRFALNLAYGIGGEFEAGMEIPFIRLSDGYLDTFIEEFEDSFGFTTPRSRLRQGKGSYKYSIKYNNGYLINTTTPTEGIGDIVLKLKYQVKKEELKIPNISLRGALKLPTADDEKLLGSGESDLGIGVIMDKKLCEKLFGYLNLDYIYIRKPNVISVFDMDNFILSGAITTEYLFTKKCSMMIQLSMHTTPYPYSQTNVLDENALDIMLGFNYKFNDILRLCGLVSENFYASSSDVNFHVGVELEF